MPTAGDRRAVRPSGRFRCGVACPLIRRRRAATVSGRRSRWIAADSGVPKFSLIASSHNSGRGEGGWHERLGERRGEECRGHQGGGTSWRAVGGGGM